MSVRPEIDQSSTLYHDGWHHGISNHAPVYVDGADYLAGWDEGFRFRLQGAERYVYAVIANDRRGRG